MLPNTVDIAKGVGCSRSTARKRLNKLEEEGKVFRLAAGRSHVWFKKNRELKECMEKIGLHVKSFPVSFNPDRVSPRGLFPLLPFFNILENLDPENWGLINKGGNSSMQEI